jgi:transposase
MGALQSLPEGAVERLAPLLQQAKTKAEYQRLQAVWLRASLGLSAPQIAQALGWQAQSVRQLHSDYLRHGEAILTGKPKGGRRHENLTAEQEQQLLAPFLAQAQAGGVLVVAPVQAAYEQAVGRPVHSSVVYRALHRQGWRKITPRPKHPKASNEAREAFKKSYPTSSRSKQPHRVRPYPCA